MPQFCSEGAMESEAQATGRILHWAHHSCLKHTHCFTVTSCQDQHSVASHTLQEISPQVLWVVSSSLHSCAWFNFAILIPVSLYVCRLLYPLQAIDKNVKYVGTARDGVDYSPKDVAKVAGFLQDESAAGQVRVRGAMYFGERVQSMRVCDTGFCNGTCGPWVDWDSCGQVVAGGCEG